MTWVKKVLRFTDAVLPVLAMIAAVTLIFMGEYVAGAIFFSGERIREAVTDLGYAW